MAPDEGVLFLTQEGDALSPERLTQLVREYVLAAETGKSGSCHLFRHTCATLMLEGGADIRYIQEIARARGAVDDADLHAGEHSPAQGGARADAPEREDRPAEGGGRDERGE